MSYALVTLLFASHLPEQLSETMLAAKTIKSWCLCNVHPMLPYRPSAGSTCHTNAICHRHQAPSRTHPRHHKLNSIYLALARKSCPAKFDFFGTGLQWFHVCVLVYIIFQFYACYMNLQKLPRNVLL